MIFIFYIRYYSNVYVRYFLIIFFFFINFYPIEKLMEAKEDSFLDDDFFYSNFLFHMNFEVSALKWKIFYKSFNFLNYYYKLVFSNPFKIYHFDYKMNKSFFELLWYYHEYLIRVIVLNRFMHHIYFPVLEYFSLFICRINFVLMYVYEFSPSTFFYAIYYYPKFFFKYLFFPKNQKYYPIFSYYKGKFASRYLKWVFKFILNKLRFFYFYFLFFFRCFYFFCFKYVYLWNF